MFSKRRAEEKRKRDANKAKAHAENHELAKSKFGSPEVKKDGAIKPRAK